MMIFTLVAWVWGGDIIISLDAFCQIISPPLPTIQKRYARGGNLIGADVECEEIEDPDGYYKALGCKKISSDEDIGVSLKKSKKGLSGLGRTHHLDKMGDKEKIELLKKAK